MGLCLFLPRATVSMGREGQWVCALSPTYSVDCPVVDTARVSAPWISVDQETMTQEEIRKGLTLSRGYTVPPSSTGRLPSLAGSQLLS